MPLKLILRRGASNIADLIGFIISFLLLNLMAGLEQTESNMYFILFCTFIIFFIVPVLTLSNTPGKMLLNLTWEKSLNRKILLPFKYLIYLAIIFPGFSVLSFLQDFPYFHSHKTDFSITIIAFVTFTAVDIFVFFLSAGKYHILDYIFLLKIQHHSFKRKELITLFIILSSCSIFICLHYISFQKNVNFSTVANHLAQESSIENFPQLPYSGNKAVVIKRKSTSVILPSKIHSFLFSKEFDQKTLHIFLPLEIFHSEKAREVLCYKVLTQSKINDFFYNYSPAQTRIFVSSVEQGKLLEYYNYFYIYYYDSKLPNWGINGGVKADSTVIHKYIKFVNGMNTSKSAQRNGNLKSVAYEMTISQSKLSLQCFDNVMTFEKIPFSKAKLHGWGGVNFPPRPFLYQTHFVDLLGNGELEYDENVENLIYSREQISEPNL